MLDVVAEVGHLNFFLVDPVDRVQLGREQTQQGHAAVEHKCQRQQRRLVVGIEGDEISRQEGDPDKDGRHDGDEDVPGLVEVVGQLTCEEAEDCAQEQKQDVEGERNEQSLQLQVALQLDVVLRHHRHVESRRRWEEHRRAD